LYCDTFIFGNFIHNDIKSDNIMIFQRGFRYIDAGISKLYIPSHAILSDDWVEYKLVQPSDTFNADNYNEKDVDDEIAWRILLANIYCHTKNYPLNVSRDNYETFMIEGVKNKAPQ